MRSALAAAAVLAVVGCKQQPPQAPASSVVEWAQQSPDRRLEIRQRRQGNGCRVEAVVKSPDGDRSLWSTQTCLPTSSGLVFLSPNGEKLLALDLFPSSQAAQASNWSRLPLISLWVRGAVVRQYTGAEILGERQSADMGKVLSWVRGDTLDDAHRAARPSADGEQVSIDLVDGRTLTLGFEGDPLPVPIAPPAGRPAHDRDEPVALQPSPLPSPPEPADGPRRAERSDRAAELLAGDEQGLYRWEDDQGALHFGAGAQIPPRYRKRARPVDATVGVVPIERPSLTATAPAGSNAETPSQPSAARSEGAAPAAGAGQPAPTPAAPPPPP
jgi:hypothetical protein